MMMNHITRPSGARFPKQWEEQAVALATENRWAAAVAANNQILDVDPGDVSALNRLGRALMELGRYDEAGDAYTRTLAVAPSNPIAQKNLARVAALREEARPEMVVAKVEPQMFLAEPGKATVTTIKLRGKAVALAKVAVGEQVELVVNGRALGVRDARGALLGAVEPRLAHRIIELMNGGNRYDAALVSGDDDAARVVIRETYQDASQFGKVSFPAQEPAVRPSDLQNGLVDEDADEEEVASDDAAEETDETTASVEEEDASAKSPDEPYFT